MTKPKEFEVTLRDSVETFFSTTVIQWIENPETRNTSLIFRRKPGEERVFKILVDVVRGQFETSPPSGPFLLDLPIRHGDVRVVFTVDVSDGRIAFTPRPA